MPSFTDLTGLAGIALVLAALCGQVLAGRFLSGKVAAVVSVGVFFLLLAPLGELPAAAYVRGMVGDLSVTTLVLLAHSVALRSGCCDRQIRPGHLTPLCLVLMAAVAFYPSALGATACDAYRWGFGEVWFVAVLLLISLFSIGVRLPLVAVSISFSLLAWSFGWYESGNLWDYLIDPLLAVYAFGRCIFAVGPDMLSRRVQS